MPPVPGLTSAARVFNRSFSSFCGDVQLLARQLSSGARTPRIMLGIETSFDDTAIGIVSEHGAVLAHEARSQASHHAAFAALLAVLDSTTRNGCSCL